MSRSAFVQYLLLSVVTLLLVGCAQNYYSIPKESYEQKVRVLGVAPIFVDAESDIRHPERDTLVNLIKEYSRKNEQELVAQLRDSGGYFSVQLLDDDPDKLFINLFFRRERREDAGITYNKYFYKGPELTELIKKNGLDAVMLVVISGITLKDTIYSSNLLSTLNTNYNNLILTSQIIDSEGSILWEFPNFRQLRLTYPTFLRLQFPDFDEARANQSDNVEVRYKSIPGINRTLSKGESSSLRKNTTVSDTYSAVFKEMISMLRPTSSLFDNFKNDKSAPPTANRPVESKQSVAPHPTTSTPQPTSSPYTPIRQNPAPTIETPGIPTPQPIDSPSIAPPS